MYNILNFFLTFRSKLVLLIRKISICIKKIIDEVLLAFQTYESL
jgi:hypothetical protein